MTQAERIFVICSLHQNFPKLLEVVRKGHPGRARYFSDVEDSKEGDIFRAMIADVATEAAIPR